MNLRDKPGFVTLLGPDDSMEVSAEEPAAAAAAAGAGASANEDATTPGSEKDNLEAAEGKPDAGEDSQKAAELDTQEDESRKAPSWNSRSDSVEMDLNDDGDGLLADTDLVQSTAWAPHSTEQSVNELHDYFCQFYSIRRIVKQTYFEFKQACQAIQDLLATNTIGESLADRGTEAWLSSSEEQTIMNVLRTDPVLMVLGCKGSGKSSVINGILGEDILPSSSAMLKFACNGIVHLKYDEVGYTKIAHTSTGKRLELSGQMGQQQQQELPQEPPQHQRPSHQVREFIEEVMSDEDRTAWANLDNCVLEIGVRNPILRTRVQFLEIPGDCFDPRLRDRLLRQLLVCNHQTVVYIIDGNKGLGNSDREFLFFLRANMPNMQIFFIINKVDYDPEAEEMDCASDEDSDSTGERFHESGAQTQRRKQKLVIDQLEKYRLASSQQFVFPVSVMRQKCPLTGSSEQIRRLNQEYESQYHSMVSALKDCLVETGRSRMELALSALFLVAARTFDAFTRDPGAEAGEGARQAEQASKELILKSFRGTKDKFKDCKATFLDELKVIYDDRKDDIIGACQRLEFGPLRLYSRIRNNEVEQQYMEQINNYVLHLLNVEIRESLERRIKELKDNLLKEVEALKNQFSKDSHNRPSSPWDDLIRTHADEIITGIVKLNFSVEWKSEAGFVKWVKKLWSGATTNKAKASSPNTPEWKSEVARDFYASIDLNVVVRKMFAGVDCTLKQAESGLLNLVNSRHKFAARLQKMLEKENPAARSVWHRVQYCLVSAEALKNLQAHGPLASGCLTEPVGNTCLGRLYHLTSGYAGCGATKDSGVAVTVTQIGTSGVAEPDSVSNWVNRLGGIPNHHLMKGQLEAETQKRVAITLMVTFTDRYELCVLHSAYRYSLKDYIEANAVEKYTKAQGFQMIRDLMQIWRLFGQEKTSLQWSLKLDRLKVSTTEGSRLVYDYLERPLPTLKKGHTIGSLFAKSESEVRSEKQAEELNNVLQLTFMILVRDAREFSSDELARIEDRELVDERHKEFKKYLVSLTAGRNCNELVRLPADQIANLWYTKPDRKVKDIEEWIERNRRQ